ncbi:hypothetical protein [Streptomyces chartreusis]
MQEPVCDVPSLRAKYAATVEEDLELVAKERERIGLEIAALQDRLRILERDEAWLAGMRETLGSRPAGAESVPPVAPVVAASPAEVSEASLDTVAAGKEPTLRELIVAELVRHGGPCSSHDVTRALDRAHPRRRIKEPGMRHALEALAKQGRVLRVKRGSRVFYVAAAARPSTGP